MDSTNPPASPTPFRPILRTEAAAGLVLLAICYHLFGYSWLIAAVLFFLPDLSMIGYMAGSRVGARCYNAVHTLAVPFLLISIALLEGWSLILQLGLIWAGHIEFDRMLGFGLKDASAFANTHLGRVGRAAE